MNQRADLKEDASYLVIGRRWGIGAVAAVLMAGGGTYWSLASNDRHQDWLIAQIQKELITLQGAQKTDHDALMEMRADIRVIRTLLEGRDPPPRRRAAD